MEENEGSHVSKNVFSLTNLKLGKINEQLKTRYNLRRH